MSIWIAVTPTSVPATLKSISPKASSIPWISVKIEKSSPYFTSPIAIPETGLLMGTPASIKDNVLPHTLPIDVDPLDSIASDTIRIV